jgi:hypothetical protein
MEEFEQHLKSLWHEGGRDQALSFLRRALNHQTSLEELLAALQFEAVAPHLATISLKDVLGAKASAAPTPVVATAHVPRAAPTQAPKGKRRRRTAEELKQIGEAILKMLVDEPGSLNTTQIVATLEQLGHPFDTMRVNGLLRTFEQEQQVVDLGGKPKAWRASPSLRQQHAE